MIYDYWCECGARCDLPGTFQRPPKPPLCWTCEKIMHRDFGGICIDTSGCKDHDEVPAKARTTQSPMGVSASRASKIEAAYAADIAAKRKANKHPGKKGSVVMSHSIPTELYHGKIRETGDKAYWQSPKNLSRHKSTKVI